MSVRRSLGRSIVTAAAVCALLVSPLAVPSSAVPGETVSAPTTSAVPAGVSSTVSGVAVSGANPASTLLVGVVTDRGTLALGTTTGLTASQGFSFSGAELSFTGLPAAVNTALATLTLNPGAGQGTANLDISVVGNTSGLAYNAGNGHYYQFTASSGISWGSAQTAAAAQTFGGLSGYLATITSSGENSFVSAKIPGASNVWIGARGRTPGGGSYSYNASTIVREWYWATGPESATVFTRCTTAAGGCNDQGGAFSSWASGEPNNSGASEDAAVTNVNGTPLMWNDLSSSSGSPDGYVTEFGTNAAGNGFTGLARASAAITAFTTPGTPTGLTATASTGGALLTFTVPASGGSPITGYQYTLNGGTTWLALPTPSGSGSAASTISGLTPGVPYTIAVRAVNAAGGGTGSSSASVTPLALPSPPGSPAAPTVVAGRGSVGLTFAVPPSGSSSITGYQYTADGGATWLPLPQPATTGGVVTATVTGLTGGTYAFSVRAVSGFGPGASSPNSQTVTVTGPTPSPTPSAPTSPVPAPTTPPPPIPTPGVPAPQPTAVTVTFPAAPSAAGITGYQYRLNGGRWRTLTVDDAAAATVTARISGLVEGTRYTISIRAVNDVGAGSSTVLRVSTPVDRSWYRDPISDRGRAQQVAVPRNPTSYRGAVRHTKARFRSRSGRPVTTIAAMNGHQLVKGQGVQLSGDELFRFDRATLTVSAKRKLRALATGLRVADAIACEGYADYGGSVRNENRLSTARAAAVCRALSRLGATVRTVSDGYGPRRPAIIGGTSAGRDGNRRVVVLVTG